MVDASCSLRRARPKHLSGHHAGFIPFVRSQINRFMFYVLSSGSMLLAVVFSTRSIAVLARRVARVGRSDSELTAPRTVL
jgi:hypothetical protein